MARLLATNQPEARWRGGEAATRARAGFSQVAVNKRRAGNALEPFLWAVGKYDPDIDRYLDLDCNRYLRLLCRCGFLETRHGEGEPKRIEGYVRSATWPPPDAFFKSGAIGVAYYLPKWLQQLNRAAGVRADIRTFPNLHRAYARPRRG